MNVRRSGFLWLVVGLAFLLPTPQRGATAPGSPVPHAIARNARPPFLVDDRYLFFKHRGDTQAEARILDTARRRISRVAVPDGCEPTGMDLGLVVLTCETTDAGQRARLLDVRSGSVLAVPVTGSPEGQQAVLGTYFNSVGQRWVSGPSDASSDSHASTQFVFINRLTGELRMLNGSEAPRGWDEGSSGLDPYPVEICRIKRWIDYERPYVLFEKNAAHGSRILSVHRCGGRTTRIARLPAFYDDESLNRDVVTWTEGEEQDTQRAYVIRTHSLFSWRFEGAQYFPTRYSAIFVHHGRILAAPLNR